ncbi:lymphocyte antigen 6E-like isoform X3 [Panthera pardus]|nr:lymphocyte antigen 6E-like isoform X3 [Panthera pardus]XP_058555272.1 lymphocyte antigen 6E-like isoform X3 [Neofelis nebulosa]
MKVFLPVLLAALLGVEQAHSLVCFSCTNQNSNFYCLKPTICSDSDNYCVTVSASAGIALSSRLGNLVDFGHTLNKGCSPICPSPSINLGVASVGTYCCQNFLCNISTAGGGLRASAAVLGLGLLLSLLSALQRLGP